MKLPQKRLFTIVFLFFAQLAMGQQYLRSIENIKDPMKRPTFFQIQKEFNDYWKPYQLKNGKYKNTTGKLVKAPGWKQFKRWEWYMEARINPITGEFPSTSTQEELDKYRAENSKLSSKAAVSDSWKSLGPNSSSGGYAGVGRVNCIAFHPTNINTYWVGTPAGGVWKTSDDGASWIPLTDYISVIGVSNIIIPSDYETSNIIYISTGDRDSWDTKSSGVLKSIDGGVTWNTTGLSFSVANYKMVYKLILDPNNNQHIIASTSNGISVTLDGGLNWNEYLNAYNDPIFIDLKAKPGDFNIIYGSTGGGEVYKSTDGGINWVKKLDTGQSYTKITVSENDENIVYAVVKNRLERGLANIYKSIDGGENFSSVFDGTILNLLGRAVDGLDFGVDQASYDLTIVASPANANTLLVGGINTWRSTDAGVSWNIVNHWTGSGGAQAVHADKHKLIYRSNGDLFEGNDGGVYMSTDNGNTFIDKSNGIVNSQMYKLGISQTDRETIITGSQDNGSKLFDNNIWRDVHGGDGMECIIDYTDANIQYSSHQRGVIYRTLNRWNGGTLNLTYKIGDGSLTGGWVTPYAIDPIDHNTLYIGYSDVWKSTDMGDSFEKITTLNTDYKMRQMAISPANNQCIYIYNYESFMKTTDGGTTWTNLTGLLPSGNYITDIEVDFKNPNKIWITSGGYNSSRVFESSDGGISWTNISIGLPNIPILCIVQRALASVNQLYVGTDVGVYVKNENENWTYYSEGLPNVMVTELEISYDKLTPDNSKLRAATYGRGLWESNLISNINTQLTFVPDDNFEQALIDLGYDDFMDDTVVTENIRMVPSLDLKSKDISDLTGIEAFEGLTELDCYDNKLEIIDISKNVLLTKLIVWKNQLTKLDVSKNLALEYLDCDENQFTSLDASLNSNLTIFFANDNQLVNLNVKNGNNSNFTYFYTIGNQMLYCIDVDNEVWSAANWTVIDSQTNFSETGCPDNGFMIEERDALIALYNATDGPNWWNNNNWNTSYPVSYWQGVTVDDNGHVTQLYLYYNNLVGIIPSEIGNFPYLKNLVIQSNPGISGVIPTEIGQLTNLEYLSFNRNNLSGNIPTTITNLTKLSNVDLYLNNFSGQVPDLTQLSLLKRFSIGYNNFDFGDFENEFANYKSNIPEYSYAPMNKKGSEISYDIVVGDNYTMTMSDVSGTEVSYQWFKNDEPIIGATSFTYTINNLQSSDAGDYICKASSPIVTGLIIERETIHVYGTISEEDKNVLIALYDATNGDNWTNNTNWKTSAPVHEWFGISVQGTRVSKIELSSNNLVGFIPKEIGLLPNILNLSLEFNQLSGTIPTEIGNLTNLKELNLWTNQLSGTIPVEIGDLTKLELISLEANQLTGNIPPEFANLTAMKSFWVNENQLTGELPNIFGSMPNLIYFSIYDNQFTGNVNLSNLTNLQRIYAWNNQLSELDISQDINLEYLYCEQNQLTALDVRSNTNLKILDINNNQIAGGIDISKNTKLTVFKALTNLALTCIQVNQTQLNAIPTGWSKDVSANYNLDCSSFIDDDGDEVMNDADNCPEIANENQSDIDEDNIGDVCDDDIDGDGILNTDDKCPEFASDNQSDIDGDGIGDACDEDVDGDGILNSDDKCPEFASDNQSDMDGDGIGDVCDNDIDGDGILNIADKCPEFASDNQSDIDGDGVGDVCDEDIDGDGILNTDDKCPEFASDNQADLDGDGIGDVCDDDIDGDGILNTDDKCPEFASSNQSDLDGDGLGDVCDDDIDGDGILNEVDNCSEVSNSDQEDIDSDGIGDVCDPDIDGDGVANTDDQCSDTPSNVNVNTSGCPVFILLADNFSIEVQSETCPNKNNGQIFITATETYSYVATINGNSQNFTNNSLTVSNLPPGSYAVCITVTGETFEQCFNLTIEDGKTVAGKTTINSKKASIDISQGTAPYNVFLNGKRLFETNSLSFDLDVKHGDLVQVKTAVDCEGVFSKTIDLFEALTVYPNPTNGIFEIALPLSLKEVKIELFTTNSQLISSKVYSVVNGKVHLNIENMPSGMYFVKVHLENPVSVKIIKK